MDSGSLMALGAVCVLVIPAVLLLMDCFQTPPKNVHQDDDDDNVTTTAATSDNANHLYGLTESIATSSARVQENDDSSETMISLDDSENGKDAILNEFKNNQTGWRCACEGGFLPPGLLQNFSGAEAVLRMSAGRCYHKKGV